MTLDLLATTRLQSVVQELGILFLFVGIILVVGAFSRWLDLRTAQQNVW